MSAINSLSHNDEMIREMVRGTKPRFIDRLLRRVPPNTVIGTIWRWDYPDVLCQREAEWWELHILPWGWSIIRDERARRRA